MKDRRILEPFVFTWNVQPSGYKWEQKADPGKVHAHAWLGWYLVPRDMGERPQTHDPLEEESGLFRAFADLPLSRQSIAEFANKYGPLVQIGNLAQTFEESLAGWQDGILRMRALVSLWEAVKLRDLELLGAIIRWQDGAVHYRLSFGEIAQSDSNFADPDFVQAGPDGTVHSLASGATFIPEQGTIEQEETLHFGLRTGDLIDPGWNVLQRLLNRQIRVHQTFPALLWNGNRELGLYMRPLSLSAAMWLQFASAVSSNHSLRACAVCDRWFQVGPEGDRRADAQFCSNSCRQRKYRKYGGGKK